MPTRKIYRQTFAENRVKKGVFRLLKIAGGLILVLTLTVFSLFLYYGKDLPRPEKFTERQLFQPTRIYDRSGEVLLSQIYGEEKRELITLEEVPEYLKQVVLVAEDANFYRHFGLDWKGIIRSLLVDLKLGELTQGGSTISQQLIRSSFLTNEKTAERKIKEIILTLDLERRFSKDQILEFYLNQIPFGHNCYGVQCASKAYFQKPVSETSLPEAAILVSLIRAPSRLSQNQDQLLQRKDYLLDRMFQERYLTEAEVEELKSQEIKFAPLEEINPVKAPHFVLEIKDYLINRYGENYLKREGLKIYTTLDWELQEKAEEVVKEWAKTNEYYNAHNATLVSIDPRTGQVLSMVGSKDFFGEATPTGCDPDQNQCLFAPQFNVATLGKRQPGSAFKPFAYFTAFEKGYTPQTLIWDVKTNFETVQNKEYIPENYTKKFGGLITLKEALAQSINVPSVKVLYLAGGEDTMETAKKTGITTLKDPFSYYGLPLVLGGGAVTLSEMVSAYGVFATEGYKAPLTSILKIEDAQGRILEEYKTSPKKILESYPCRLINDILSDNLARAPLFGANSALYFKDYQVAAKTGTTQNYIDAWTIGYSPTIVTGVWVGNNDNSPMAEKPGISLAGPIFHSFMETALVKYPSGEFEKPEQRISANPTLDGQISEFNHSILHYIKKEDPLGPPPDNPESDPQYLNWEKGIKDYILEHET